MPRYVQILAHLVLRPGEVFSKNALLDEFWGDVAVTDNTVEQAIGAIRKAIDDDPSRPQFIQTVKRKGYRFERAIKHARQACALDPCYAEGWATLGLLLVSVGEAEQAHGAARRATMLDASSWRHAFRLSVASWGDERLAAVDRTLSLVPGFAPARLVSAMVFVAHGNLADASDILERLLRKSPPGQMGWMIPIDPALVPLRRESCFERVLARLASRAS